ncbi:hypothetical protein [Dulcicalothrix desertica]|nr:hypothetical protein [Dulcicalothrix desertica]
MICNLTINAPIGLQMGLQPGQIASSSIARDNIGNAINGLGS